MTAARVRYFIRFGEVPEDGRSRMWNAPNLYMHDKIGQVLPGLSAYHAKMVGGKWVLDTDDINVGSGIASLMACFHRAVVAPEANKIYLLKGVATTWRNLTPQERETFDDMYPGNDRYEMLGTDGEPLVRDFEVAGTVEVSDLVCKMIAFPEDWEDELDQTDEPGSSDSADCGKTTSPRL